uniref:Uncharacterized protein n=1 Tax=Arundo donax TaxID=35708 RepID=A0A0A9ACI2_ARUDO
MLSGCHQNNVLSTYGNHI